MLFDTHAHYDDEAFDPDRELLLESLPQRGVALVLNPGCDLDSSRTFHSGLVEVYVCNNTITEDDKHHGSKKLCNIRQHKKSPFLLF